jgi:hypothetical protein
MIRQETGKSILSTFLRRLTNLTGSSRSLLLLRLHAEQLLDIHDFGFLAGHRAFEIVNALIAGQSKILCPVLDSRMEASNVVSKKVKRLQRVDRFIFEERGSNDLHVGWPFVRGKFADGTLTRCPLLYFPVRLTQIGANWVLEPRKDAGVTLNKSFLLAYSLYSQVALDEELLDTNFEEFDTDSTVFRTQLYQLLRDKIELNFNPENFQDDLIPFTLYKKSEFEEQHRHGELKLFPEAVLGIFPQAGSQLVPDYVQLIESNTFHDLEGFFAEKIGQGEQSSGVGGRQVVSEERLHTPFTLDAYQESAVHAVKHGRSIVVQGPPGTGKSQLIGNLMADALASGKRALLVCQKRAALDVVFSRLSEIGLSDFLGLVHDFRNDRKEIYNKIAQQIQGIEDYKKQNRSVDVIQTERRFYQLCRRIDQISEELEEFKFALFDDTECGLSVKELYLTSDLLAPSINIRQDYQHFNFSEVPGIARRLRVYFKYASWMEKPDYPWRDRRSFGSLQAGDERACDETISDIPAYQEEVAGRLQDLFGAPLSLADCHSLFNREQEILGMVSVLTDEDIYGYFQHIVEEPDEETSTLWFSNVERVALNCFVGEQPERTLTTDQLGNFQEVLQECMQARRNLWKFARWELFSKKKFGVKRVMIANELPYGKSGFRTLEKRIDNRLNLEHHLTILREKGWLLEIPSDFRKAPLQNWFLKQRLAIRAKLLFNTLRELRGLINVQRYSRPEFITLMRDVLTVVKDVPEKMREWQGHLTGYQITQLIQHPELVSIYRDTLHADFDSLCEYDRLKEQLTFYEVGIFSKLHDHLESWDSSSAEQLFQNSIRLAWIGHIETKYPILRAVSSLKMEALQTELRQCLEEKEKLSKEILIVRARERVYESLEYNRLNNLVTYRDLLHQVTKKKKVWPVRKLISDFHYELFQLIPCWLASPESVSAIFPMVPLFDVVIFDEASQCFSERGIPAMFRGKQIVVAGDEKQLRPSDLYQIRWEDESTNPDEEVDSLLALTTRYLPTHHLQGHYRSKAMELIAFSNTHFYDGRLQLLPDRELINRGEPAIEYHHVEGLWEDQTNKEEAESVVRKIFEYGENCPGKSIGVVTFNAPQQMLIMDVLEAEATASGKAVPAALFVKNIENVQGDECDIILFSVGYAPDKTGRMIMQFGSLNTSGGENRLNVAITRAREKIVLFTSITPEQLRVGETRNSGPALLRKYLEYAREVGARQFVPQTAGPAQRQPAAWYLSSRLRQWGEQRMQGFAFETNRLPYCDINVMQDGRYLGAVLTDDARYFGSPSAKDVHAYTPVMLSQKNWKYHMVFSRNFWKDRDKVESDLMVFVGSQVLQKEDV